MQRRYRIASTDTYPEAAEAKRILTEKFPEERFQIRKTHKGFSVVKRATVSEAKDNITVKAKNQKGNKRGYAFEQHLR